MPVGRHVNPADHFLELINYQFQGGRDKDDDEGAAEKGQDGDDGKDGSTDLDEEGAGSNTETHAPGAPAHVRKLVENFPKSKAAECNRKRMEMVHDEEFEKRTEHLCKHVKGKYATPFWWQTLVLMLRTLLVFVKNPSVYWVRVLMYFLLALMMGTLFFQISDDQKVALATFFFLLVGISRSFVQAIQDRISVLFFSVAFLTFMSIAALPAFIQDRILFVRERMNNAYRCVFLVVV